MSIPLECTYTIRSHTCHGRYCEINLLNNVVLIFVRIKLKCFTELWNGSNILEPICIGYESNVLKTHCTFQVLYFYFFEQQSFLIYLYLKASCSSSSIGIRSNTLNIIGIIARISLNYSKYWSKIINTTVLNR